MKNFPAAGGCPNLKKVLIRGVMVMTLMLPAKDARAADPVCRTLQYGKGDVEWCLLDDEQLFFKPGNWREALEKGLKKKHLLWRDAWLQALSARSSLYSSSSLTRDLGANAQG